MTDQSTTHAGKGVIFVRVSTPARYTAHVPAYRLLYLQQCPLIVSHFCAYIVFCLSIS